MQIVDAQLQALLKRLYTGINVNDVAKSSGQRVVYFCTFDDFEIEMPEGTVERRWSNWGEVVVKVSTESSLDNTTRILQEIEILKQIDSPYYPKHLYYELITFDPTTEFPLEIKLLVTIEERIPSVPLSQCMERFEDEQSASRLLRSLIEALLLLWEHEKKYVHRDLKPDNILITAHDIPVIIDLGIIRETGQPGLTNTYAAVGPCTPLYASPEQIRNDKRNISYKSDLFSLGIIAYQLVSKRHPFITSPSDDVQQLLQNICELTPSSLHDLGACSESFSNIVMKLLAKQPYERYRRLETLQQELQKIGNE